MFDKGLIFPPLASLGHVACLRTAKSTDRPGAGAGGRYGTLSARPATSRLKDDSSCPCLVRIWDNYAYITYTYVQELLSEL